MGISDQAQPPPPRGTLKILWEGLKLPCNNFALLHPVLLLSFLASSLSFLLSYLCLTPLILDLTTKSTLIGSTDPESPEYSLLLTAVLKDLKELGLIEVVTLVISFIVNSLVAAATVHVLSTAYSSMKAPSKPKEVFAGFDWSLIKRATITQLYGAFVTLGCSLMFVLTAGVLSLSFIYSSSSSRVELVAILALGVIVAGLEVCLYLYLLMVVRTSVVVSVVEEGCYGLEAITKATKLIGGRRVQAIRIASAELVVAEVFYVVYSLVTARAPPAQLALGFGQVALGVVVNVLIWSVQTVYYYECSGASHGEEFATKGGFQYTPVPTQVNEALL